MASNVFNGTGSYLIFAEDTAFGTAGTPTGSNYVDKTSTTSYSITNNFVRSHGIGEGRNATQAVPGGLDVSGSTEFELTDPDFLKYCVIGLVTGSGTVGSPYLITEASDLGYSASTVNTLTLEVGSIGDTADVMTFDGCAINSWSLSGTADETIKGSFEWLGRQATSSTSSVTYVPPSNPPMTFQAGALSVAGDTVGKLVSFELTSENNLGVYRTLGSRLINQPVAGIRRYDFTVTVKMNYDDAASTLNAVELRALAMGGLTTSTTCSDVMSWDGKAMSFVLTEGAVAGDRVITVNLADCYFENPSASYDVETQAIELTVSGFALGGTSSIPIQWYTVS